MQETTPLSPAQSDIYLELKGKFMWNNNLLRSCTWGLVTVAFHGAQWSTVKPVTWARVAGACDWPGPACSSTRPQAWREPRLPAVPGAPCGRGAELPPWRGIFTVTSTGASCASPQAFTLLHIWVPAPGWVRALGDWAGGGCSWPA